MGVGGCGWVWKGVTGCHMRKRDAACTLCEVHSRQYIQKYYNLEILLHVTAKGRNYQVSRIGNRQNK